MTFNTVSGDSSDRELCESDVELNQNNNKIWRNTTGLRLSLVPIRFSLCSLAQTTHCRSNWDLRDFAGHGRTDTVGLLCAVSSTGRTCEPINCFNLARSSDRNWMVCKPMAPGVAQMFQCIFRVHITFDESLWSNSTTGAHEHGRCTQVTTPDAFLHNHRTTSR